MVLTTTIPSTTFPNTTCLPSSLWHHMKTLLCMWQLNSKPMSEKYATSKNIKQSSLPASLAGANEELWAVGVGSSVGHGQSSLSPVLQGEVLIRKLTAIDGLPTGSIMVGEVSTLQHQRVKSQRDHQWSQKCGFYCQLRVGLPGTWNLEWHDGSRTPYSRNLSLRCTERGSSLFG